MIVENNKQLKKFLKDFKSKESIILPIEQDSNLHPQKSKLSLLIYFHLHIYLNLSEFLYNKKNRLICLFLCS